MGEKVEDKIEYADEDKKITTLREYLANESSELANSGQTNLKEAAQNVSDAGNALNETLSNALQALQEMLNKCSYGFTGISPNRKYLLDVCLQTGHRSINEEQGRHVGCCCGYVPLTFLGQKMLNYSIPGLADHLDSKKTTRVHDICAESWDLSQARHGKVTEKIKVLSAELGIQEQELIQQEEDAIASNCRRNDTNSDYVTEFRCFQYTGGTCQFFDCDQTRGPANCVNSKCICQDGYCAVEGKCKSLEKEHFREQANETDVEEQEEPGGVPWALVMSVSGFVLLAGGGAFAYNCYPRGTDTDEGERGTQLSSLGDAVS